MEETFSIIIGPSTMMEAAEEGDIEVLYELIREKPDVLRKKYRKGFVDTPLHVAAAAGNTEFAMELMGLKPSLARKLNQDGLSPIHLALLKGHSKTVLSLIAFDKSLARVKGKKGFTPLHYVVMKELDEDYREILNKFLDECPECSNDFTNRKETALHVAAENNNLKAIRVLLKSLWSSGCNMAKINEILDSPNIEGNTVLHVAASHNQPKIVRLLTRTRINFRATKLKNLTALGILLQGENQEDSKECLKILRSAQHPKLYSIPWGYVVDRFNRLADDVRKMPDGKSNTLLVVAVLILTATYQATLSPPGVFQANSHPKDNTTTSTDMQIHSGSTGTGGHLWDMRLNRTPLTAGSSVLNAAPFLWFFIPNIAAFCISFLVTYFILISILNAVFWSTLVVAMSMLFCLLVSAVQIISPNSQSATIMLHYVYILAYSLIMVMYLTIFIVVGIRLKFMIVLGKRHTRPKP